MAFLDNLLVLFLDAAPWLLLGFLAAGLIKVWIPDGALTRWLGGKGLWPISKAALIGAPLPLCSCGVLPAALGLRRNGASNGSTVSFLIATPETGAESIALSYALLGPFLAIVRPIAAVVSAIFAGVLTSLVPEARAWVPVDNSIGACNTSCSGANGRPDETRSTEQLGTDDAGDIGCCGSAYRPRRTWFARTAGGMRFAMIDVMDDIVLWIAVGLLLAAAVMTQVSPMALSQWGGDLSTMMLMLLVAIPMYICATASTPIAAALLVAGMSPGTVLVFLLAGPATNIATMGVVRREMGSAVLIAYLTGICLSSVGLGLLTNIVVAALDLNIRAQISEGTEGLPVWIAFASGFVLLVAAGMSVARKLQRILNNARTFIRRSAAG